MLSLSKVNTRSRSNSFNSVLSPDLSQLSPLWLRNLESMRAVAHIYMFISLGEIDSPLAVRKKKPRRNMPAGAIREVRARITTYYIILLRFLCHQVGC